MFIQLSDAKASLRFSATYRHGTLCPKFIEC